jgi:hypothetical protein
MEMTGVGAGSGHDGYFALFPAGLHAFYHNTLGAAKLTSREGAFRLRP